MAAVFADTAYWIALLNPRDNLHDKAVAVSRKLGKHRIVTSEMVFTELLNAFVAKGDILRIRTCELIGQIRSNPNAMVVNMSHFGFEAALHLYRTRSDKTWGLTDCTSFVIMDEEDLTEALTADRDFQQAGYRALLAD